MANTAAANKIFEILATRPSPGGSFGGDLAPLVLRWNSWKWTQIWVYSKLWRITRRRDPGGSGAIAFADGLLILARFCREPRFRLARNATKIPTFPAFYHLLF